MIRVAAGSAVVLLSAFISTGAVQASVNATGDIAVQRAFFQVPAVERKSPAPATGPDPAAAAGGAKCSPVNDLAGLVRKYDHAIKRYLRSKTRSILADNTILVKEGMTLSQIFPDYRHFKLVIRTLAGHEIPVENGAVQKKYYIWKEDEKIVMGADVMLMSPGARKHIMREALGKARRRWAEDEYYRVAEKTRRVATSTPFRLDCQHTAELDGLIRKATRDLLAQKDHLLISPRKFDRLLTILRAYITFNYYKDLSHDDFAHRFKMLGRKEGRGFWSHQKLTRLLGLHVMGRIESNRAFRKTYQHAIDRAARRTPAIPRRWIEEIIWIETKGDPMTISRAGAYGLMQLMPLVYIGLGPEKAQQLPLAFERTINPFNADKNIERGAIFLDKLRRLLKPYMRGYSRATRKKIIFHAYNTGVTRVISLLKKYGAGYTRHLPDETKAYLDKLADFPGRQTSSVRISPEH